MLDLLWEVAFRRPPFPDRAHVQPRLAGYELGGACCTTVQNESNGFVWFHEVKVFNVQGRDLEKSSGLSCPRAVTDGGKSTDTSLF